MPQAEVQKTLCSGIRKEKIYFGLVPSEMVMQKTGDVFLHDALGLTQAQKEDEEHGTRKPYLIFLGEKEFRTGFNKS